MKDGDYIGGRAPTATGKTRITAISYWLMKLLPCGEADFEWAHDRVSLNRIVLNLNEMGIPAPSITKNPPVRLPAPA